MRFRELTESEMTQDQLDLYREICAGPRGGFRGPLHVLIRAPQLAERAAHLGEYVRYNSSLTPRISELAILVAARYWSSQFEWFVHEQHALKAGLAPEVIAQLAQGERPSTMLADEASAYQFCTELHHEKFVSTPTFDDAMRIFGEVGVVDLTGISGYYTLVSMALNLNRHPLPDGVSPPLKALKGASDNAKC